MKSLRDKVNTALADYEHASRLAKEERTALATAEAYYTHAAKAQAVVQAVAEGVQAKATGQIARVVTRCLKAVFGKDAYEFAIRFTRKRGKTEAKLTFVRDGNDVSPTGAAGGGAVDVASFALRLACLILSRPLRRRLLVSDEPFHHVNGTVYQERVGQMLLTLAEEMQVQFLIISDDDWLEVGKVVRL